MAQGILHSQDYNIRPKQGVVANINTDATKNQAVEGELHWATDTDDLYIFDGTQNNLIGGKSGTSMWNVSSNVLSPTTDGDGVLIDVPTASRQALVLQTTDDDTTNKILLVNDSSDTRILEVSNDGLGLGGSPGGTKGIFYVEGNVGSGNNIFGFKIIASGATYEWRLGANNSRSTFGLMTYNDLYVGTDNNFQHLILKGNDNNSVGIAETSPQGQLHVTAKVDRKGLIVQGNASQTNNLIEAQNSSATTLFKVESDGDVAILDSKGYGWGSRTTRIDGTAAGQIMQFIVANTNAMQMVGGGNIGVGTTNPQGKFHISGIADDQQLIVQANATQTEDLTEWQDSGGTPLSGVTPDGYWWSSRVYVGAVASGTYMAAGSPGFRIHEAGSEIVRISTGSILLLNAGTIRTSASPLTVQAVQNSAGWSARNFNLVNAVASDATVGLLGVFHSSDTFTNRVAMIWGKGQLSLGSIAASQYPEGQLHVQTYDAGVAVAVLEAAATQTANILETHDSSANVLSGADERGVLFSKGSTDVGSVWIGDNAGNMAATGTANVGIGQYALDAVTSGEENVAIGTYALSGVNLGSRNMAIGYGALRFLTASSDNVAIGQNAATNTTGRENMAIGRLSLRQNTSGKENVAIGSQAGRGASAIVCEYNVWIGAYSGYAYTSNVTGNTILGYEAHRSATSGNYNIMLGYCAGYRQTTASNLLIVDNTQRADAATEQSNAILYGTMAASPEDQELQVNANLGTPNKAETLGVGVTTFAVESNVMTITGDGGGNTIATITGAVDGTILTLIFVDANVTITDDNTHGADSIDLSAAFTSADDTVLQLVYDGTSWYEVSRSVN